METMDDFICSICNSWDDDLQDGICAACNETCPHGMSMWLCAHPIYHYPTDEMMMNGRYY